MTLSALATATPATAPETAAIAALARARHALQVRSTAVHRPDPAAGLAQLQRRAPHMLERITERFGICLAGRSFGLWGDEAAQWLVDSPLVAGLLRRGATVSAHDPLALPGVRNAGCAGLGLHWTDSPLAVAEGASALLLAGDGAPPNAGDLAALRGLMAHPVLLDLTGRGDASLSAALGFVHVGVARPRADEPFSRPTAPLALPACPLPA
ncbi:UDP binding domain-containing protein [Ideonella sp. DXS22W]|uniref:UDP binding domain-containing protein n=1 Tax=Pseudaquabacterium inlustre TaxID=2984192 RepID=A0ABU9CHR1_9BURK